MVIVMYWYQQNQYQSDSYGTGRTGIEKLVILLIDFYENAAVLLMSVHLSEHKRLITLQGGPNFGERGMGGLSW